MSLREGSLCAIAFSMVALFGCGRDGAGASDASDGACPSTRTGDAGGDREGGGHMHPEDPTPESYRDMVNPYGYTNPALGELGRATYQAECARCHGADGNGKGTEAANLCPPPADLHVANRLHDDPYFYWLIHDGGTIPGARSAMPAFGQKLDAAEIWRVITFIRWTFDEF